MLALQRVSDSVRRSTLKRLQTSKRGGLSSRAGGKAPEEGKCQESYSGAPRVKLGSKVECNKTGVKLQGRLKLRMEAGFCKKTRGWATGCRGWVVRRGNECGKSDRCSEGNHEE